jgi:cyclohexanecarboxylate-CoA ligase
MNRRNRLGITEDMIAAFGPVIFELSINVQDRSGDPVRLLQFDEIERQRDGAGLTDAQIAARLGLATDQVTFIRVLLEQRHFKPEKYYRLFQLGGGKRFRVERDMDQDAYYASQFGPDALAVRNALRFRPDAVRQELASGRWNGDTVATHLRYWARNTPGALAVAAPACPPLSYADALDQSERLAAALAGLGIRRGDVIMAQLPSGPHFAVAYYASALIGAVLSTLHMPYGSAEAEPLLRHSRAAAVVCGAASDKSDPPAMFAALASRVRTLRHVVSVGPARPGVLALADLIAGDCKAALPSPVAADPALMCYTSGTSTAPKAVPHSSQSMLANPRACAPIFRIAPGDGVISAAPLSHAFGIYVANVALMSGATLHCLPTFTPPGLAELIEAVHPSHAFVAPAHVAAMLQTGVLDDRNLPSLRQVVVSGSYCAPALKREFEKKLPKGKVFELWGMTETFAVLLGNPDDPAELRHGFVGRPTPGSKARIVGPDGRTLAAGVEGELEVRGCSVFAGYFENDAANASIFTPDGWMRSGDLAVMSESGHFRLTGRLKDIINRGGVKLNPSDVEALIDKHAGVLQSAIVPMPDPMLGERACCFVTVRPDAIITLEDVNAWLERHDVAKFKWPERLEIVDAMPLTPTRKIIKGELVKRLAAR